MSRPNTFNVIWKYVSNYGDHSKCWEWQRHLNAHNYGTIKIKGKQWLAHRAAYLIVHGSITDGMFICHHCDNPKCCNPDHLFEGTAKDNSQDASKKGRLSSGDKHYSKTHPEEFKMAKARGARNGQCTHPELCPKGERHGRARIKDDDIPKIFAMYSTGLTQIKIAEIFKVSNQQISNIIRGVRKLSNGNWINKWKDLDKWEDELARGFEPDLTEGLSSEERAKELAAIKRNEIRNIEAIKADEIVGDGFMEKYQ